MTWEVLREATETMLLLDETINLLDAPGRALHVALHAAQHGSRLRHPLEDLARAVAQVSFEVWEGACSVFNVGSMEEVTILDVAERVVAATGSASTIEFVPYERAYEHGFEDMRRRIPDISKVKELTGWEPKRTLGNIVAELVAEARAGKMRAAQR